MKLFIFIWFLLGAGIAARGYADEVLMKEEWFETRPVCFGRYVADVPKILQPIITEARLENFNIINLGPATQTEFAAKIDERRHMMETGGPVDDMGTVKFQGEQKDGSATILIYDFASRFEKEYVPPQHNVEVYVLSAGHLFQMKGIVDKNRRDKQLAMLFRIAQAIRPRALEEIPLEPGYCFQDGFVKIDDLSDTLFEMSMRNQAVDEEFVFFVDVRSGQGLNQKEYDWPSEATRRSVAGLNGVQAWGAMGDSNPDLSGYAGEFYGYRSVGSGQPDISMQIRTERRFADPLSGGGISLGAAHKFWETVLNSMKWRD